MSWVMGEGLYPSPRPGRMIGVCAPALTCELSPAHDFVLDRSRSDPHRIAVPGLVERHARRRPRPVLLAVLAERLRPLRAVAHGRGRADPLARGPAPLRPPPP